MLTKKFILGSTWAFLVVGIAAYAQIEEGQANPSSDRDTVTKPEGPDRPDRRGHRPPPLHQIIEDFDANGDGMLQKSEAPEQFPAQAFEHIDANGDGAIDITEAERAHEMRSRREGTRGQRERGDRRPPEGRERRGDRDGFQRREGREGRNDGRDSRGGNFSEIIERFDLNGDGKLQTDEAPDRMLRMFARLDRNRDGVVDSHEANSSIRDSRGPDGPASRRGDRRADRGEGPSRGDRSEHRDEIGRGDRAEHSDRGRPSRRDGDFEDRGFRGRGRAEDSAAHGNRPPMSEIIAHLDTNGDDLLQESEVPEQMLPMFDRMDRNGDGVVDMKEAIARKRGQRRGNGAGSGPRRRHDTRDDSPPAP